ncbi:glycoside hydrolase family 28 protein [Belliella sp. DSM 111904]|uniref:Glycoside hydrolase family 28 protein n=1 Tax=Belliella filtrata TaxID=2923435 RepID=A0ABS9UVB9_9BACT|nr:glycoside hydrolase family 28 protein [Belliella filtrata]MCH7408081.1 glycoside hydrolase family 28 protein [Belliella filtrata]
MLTRILFVFMFCIASHISYAMDLEGWIDVTRHGVSQKGEISTKQIQKIIDDTSAQGGGTIYFPAGEYLTGAIHLKSNINLHLDAGALLKFSTDLEEYLPFVKMRWEGTVMQNFSPLIYAYQAENISITGRGKIDGQGKAWWEEMYRIRYPKEELPLNKYQILWDELNPDLKTEPYYQGTIGMKFFRPPLIQVFECKNIKIEGLTIVNSPFWTVNPAFSEDIKISGLTIINPPSPNTDGINPTSCKNVHISDCHISVGDDCITIKSGRDIDGRKYATATENVTITNCTMLSGHGGVVIGSEVSGDIRKVTISNCIFDGTDRGIRIKSARGRGGIVEEIRVSNIVMNNIQKEAIVLDLFYDKESKKEPISERTPIFRNIHIANVTGTDVNVAGSVHGISEMPIDNISFSNINMEAKNGFSVHTAKNVEFHDVQISTTTGSSFIFEDVENLIVDNVKTRDPLQNTAVVKLKNVSNALLHNNFQMIASDLFFQIEGERSSKIFMKNNTLTNVRKPIEEAKDLKRKTVRQ